jgi:hypothetical protein
MRRSRAVCKSIASIRLHMPNDVVATCAMFSEQMHDRKRQVPHRKLWRRVCGERGLTPLDGHCHDDLRANQTRKLTGVMRYATRTTAMPASARRRRAPSWRLAMQRDSARLQGQASSLAVVRLFDSHVVRYTTASVSSCMANFSPAQWRAQPRHGSRSTSPRAARQRSRHPAGAKFLVQRTGSRNTCFHLTPVLSYQPGTQTGVQWHQPTSRRMCSSRPHGCVLPSMHPACMSSQQLKDRT